MYVSIFVCEVLRERGAAVPHARAPVSNAACLSFQSPRIFPLNRSTLSEQIFRSL